MGKIVKEGEVHGGFRQPYATHSADGNMTPAQIVAGRNANASGYRELDGIPVGMVSNGRVRYHSFATAEGAPAGWEDIYQGYLYQNPEIEPGTVGTRQVVALMPWGNVQGDSWEEVFGGIQGNLNNWLINNQFGGSGNTNNAENTLHANIARYGQGFGGVREYVNFIATITSNPAYKNTWKSPSFLQKLAGAITGKNPPPPPPDRPLLTSPAPRSGGVAPRQSAVPVGAVSAGQIPMPSQDNGDNGDESYEQYQNKFEQNVDTEFGNI